MVLLPFVFLFSSPSPVPFINNCRLNLLLVPSLQVLNYTETFYAPPVVMVTVSHLYDSNNVYSVKPENNVLNAWIEVKWRRSLLSSARLIAT